MITEGFRFDNKPHNGIGFQYCLFPDMIHKKELHSVLYAI